MFIPSFHRSLFAAMLDGCARVSTDDQTPALQLAARKKAGLQNRH
jgi:hypothetical protein